MSDAKERFSENHTYDHTEYFNRIGLTTNNEEAIFTLGMVYNHNKQIDYTYSFAISIDHLARLRDLLNRVFKDVEDSSHVSGAPKDRL